MRVLILVLSALVVALAAAVLVQEGGGRGPLVGARFYPGALLYDAKTGEEATYRDQEGNTLTWTVERRMKTHEMTTKPPSADRVQRWRKQMSEEQRLQFEEVAGDLLAELGYPVGEPVDAATV